jgi:heptosyltransferase-2
MKAFADLENRYRFVKPSRRLIMAAIDFVGYALMSLFRGSVPGSAPAPTPQSIRRVLVIQWDHLGDAVITTSILPALKAGYSRATVDALAAPWNAEVFAVRRDVGRIHLSRFNRFQRGWAALLWPFGVVYWAWKLRSFRYDLAVDVRGDFTIALAMRLAGIPHRIGWASAGGGFLLTHSTPLVRGRPEVESRAAVLRTLGITPAEPVAPLWRSTPDARRFVTEMLGEFRRADCLLVFHVGAGTRAKQWPVEHWRELLGRAIVEFDARVILVGGPGDMSVAEQITERRYWPNVTDWTGRITVDQLAALAARASAFVGADSGPAHVAAAAGAKVIALFSGTNDAAQWRPHGDAVVALAHNVPCAPCYHTSCPLAGHLCMSGLDPATVVAALAVVLGGTSAIPPPHFVDVRARNPGERS